MGCQDESRLGTRLRYQTFHSSNETLIRLVLLSRARTWSAVATTSVMNVCMLTEEARSWGCPPVLVVGVRGDEIDLVVDLLENGRLPGPEGGHLSVGAATSHQLQTAIELTEALA